MKKTLLWEIMVPTVRNDGTPFRLRYHRVWDEKVRKISPGLTIMKPATGQWIDPADQTLYKERMIPVRIACSREQIEEIMDMTGKYYDQIAVMAFLVSEVCLIKTRGE